MEQGKQVDRMGVEVYCSLFNDVRLLFLINTMGQLDNSFYDTNDTQLNTLMVVTNTY